jgi:methyl-accepting chemotaxis protein
MIVNREFQFRVVWVMLLLVFLTSAAAMAAVYWGLRVTLHTFTLARDYWIVPLFRTVFWTIAAELIVILPFVCWLGIWLSHKIAGPLVRIHRAIAEMAQGNFDIRLTLRKGDAIHAVADEINRLAAFLRSRSHSS